MILGMSEKLFWEADYSFIISVAENKNAFDSWCNYEREKNEQEMRKWQQVKKKQK